MPRPRILFLAPRHPFPPWRGDQLRAYHLARNLARVADVRVLCFGEDSGPAPDLPSVHALGATVGGRLLANLSRPSPTLPLQVRAFLDTGMRRAVREGVRTFSPDVLHVTLSRMAPYLSEGTDCHRHLDVVDSMWLNMITRGRESPFPTSAVFALEARLIGRYEALAVAEVDSASVVSEADRRVPGLERAAVVPNGVEPEDFPYDDPGGRPATALFFGNLGYFHNVAAVRFLVGEVLGPLRDRVPGAVLRLAGARPALAVRRLATRQGVELIANPPELLSALHGAAVATLPMLSGSGMKNKVLEAFCAGLPVVTNEAGIEGIEGAIPGMNCVVAEGADALADAVARLIADPDERIRLARSARALAVERYSWRRRVETLMRLYGFRDFVVPQATSTGPR